MNWTAREIAEGEDYAPCQKSIFKDDRHAWYTVSDRTAQGYEDVVLKRCTQCGAYLIRSSKARLMVEPVQP